MLTIFFLLKCMLLPLKLQCSYYTACVWEFAETNCYNFAITDFNISKAWSDKCFEYGNEDWSW